MKITSTPKIIICDIGSYSLKFGHLESKNPYKVLNSHVKHKKASNFYYSDQFQEIHDCTSLSFSRPLDKGYLTNIDLQESILQHHLFTKPKGKRGNRNSYSTFVSYNNKEIKIIETLESFKPFTPIDKSNLPFFLGTENLFGIEPTFEAIDELLFERLKFPKICLNDPKVYALFIPNEYFCRLTFSPLKSVRTNNFDNDNNKSNKNNLALDRDTCIVIDSSFSFTRIMLVVGNATSKRWMMQIDVGGKLVTEQFVKLVSHRKIDLAGDFLVANDIKESFLKLSLDYINEFNYFQKTLNSALLNKVIENEENENDKYNDKDKDINIKGFNKDEKLSEKSFSNLTENLEVNCCRKYLLPNKSDILRGFPLYENREKNNAYKNNENYDILNLEAELIRPTEVFFRPFDFGVNQMGLAEAIRFLVERNILDLEVRKKLLRNVICIGGNFNLENFALRLGKELKKEFDESFEICVYFNNNTEWKDDIVSKLTKGIEFKEGKRISSEDLVWIGMNNFLKTFENSKSSNSRDNYNDKNFLGIKRKSLKNFDEFFLSIKEIKEMGKYKSRKRMSILKILD